jgi:hypothetical protein
VSGGYRALSEETFEGHGVFAFELVTLERRSGWGYEVGASYGSEEESGPREHEAEFDEYSLGLRRTFQPAGSRVRPYLALGGAFTRVEHVLSNPRFELEDDGAAAYAHGGVLWPLGALELDTSLDVLAGLDLRGLVGDDYDYGQIAFVLAFGG